VLETCGAHLAFGRPNDSGELGDDVTDRDDSGVTTTGKWHVSVHTLVFPHNNRPFDGSGWTNSMALCRGTKFSVRSPSLASWPRLWCLFRQTVA
jgi:hypothetical protein